MDDPSHLALPRLTLQSTHAAKLSEHFETHPQGHERAAVVFFRRIERPVVGLKNSDRYLSVDVTLFPDEWINSSSAIHVDFETKHLRELFRRCEEEDLVLGFAHNHPDGTMAFSAKDDANEELITSAIANRNGKASILIALLYAKGNWAARIRSGIAPQTAGGIRHIVVVGTNFQVFGTPELKQIETEIFCRQLSAFGEPFTRIMQTLRFVVIGVGGTGSPTANLLIRCGAGEVILIDGDLLSTSNLNRVQGMGLKDVAKNKAEVLAAYLNELGLPSEVAAVPGLIDQDLAAIEALASADIIFGCTDDYLGRDAMNVALYFYLQPLIDMGLGGRVGEDRHGVMRLLNQKGRVSLILPEEGKCLYCQREVNEQWVNTQRAKRSNPNISEAELKERYLTGGGAEAPGVAPFTGALSNFAVSTLFELIVPHRNLPPELRRDNFWIDFTNMEIKSNMPIEDRQCPYCSERLFLAGSERNGYLGRPALKRRKIT